MEDMIEHLEMELEPMDTTPSFTFTTEGQTELFRIEPIDSDNIHVIDFSAGVELEGRMELDIEGFQIVSWDVEEIPSISFEAPARSLGSDLLRILERERDNSGRPEAAPSLTKNFDNLNDPRLGAKSGDWGI
jgi:hypothetical protein